jgi:hypothetical protein
LLNGEDGIKAAGELYLPKLSGQTDEEYKAYKARGTFFNAYSITISGLTGAIIRKEMTIKTNPKIDDLLGSITLAGESVQEVTRLVLDNVLSYGYYGILVDMPPTPEGDKVMDGNPYWALYDCSSILNFETVQIGDENKLVMLALAEVAYEKSPDNPLLLIAVDKVRLLQIDDNGYLVVKIYVKKKSSTEKGEEVWAQEGNDLLPQIRGKRLDSIPFVFFGAMSNNPIPTAPPLLDLANLNVKHWQVTVDYYHGLHYCAMPTPWAAGFPASTVLYVGAMKAWISEDPNAKCGFLEFSGQGLSAIEKALKNLESQMAVMGSRMLEEQKKAAEAAETVAMRYSGDSATLSSIVNSVEQGIIKAIDLLGMWLVIEPSTEVKLNRDFVAQQLAPQQITALLQSWQAGGISLDTFLYNLSVGEVLPADRTIEQEKELIEATSPEPANSNNNSINDDQSNLINLKTIFSENK